MRVQIVIEKGQVSSFLQRNEMLEAFHWSALDNMMDGPWHTTNMLFRDDSIIGGNGQKIEVCVLEADLHEGLPERSYDVTTFRSDWVPSFIRQQRNMKTAVVEEVV